MNEPVRTLRRAKSLTDQAAEQIRARIVGGEFELGAPLSENTLAAELGVSKTPVREALLRLRMEGLVSILPRRGTVVFDMTADEIRELGELRETLELAALRLAAGRNRIALVNALDRIVAMMGGALADDDIVRYRKLDAEFHQALFDHCGNRFIVSAYESFAFRVQALRTRLSVDPALNRSSYRDHQALCALIENDRIDEAAERLSAHVRATIANYAATITAHRGTMAS
ncbi:MAG: GntR family transcriptional regulator [Alphaproteobacteria bacterium]